MTWSWLFPWFKNHPAQRSTVEILFYTRSGCHLCEEAWELLNSARQKYGFALKAVDVDSDPGLAAEHGEQVPVVAVNGKVRFRGQVNPVLLKRLLDNA
jgi:glutaredoxin